MWRKRGAGKEAEERKTVYVKAQWDQRRGWGEDKDRVEKLQ